MMVNTPDAIKLTELFGFKENMATPPKIKIIPPITHIITPIIENTFESSNFESLFFCSEIRFTLIVKIMT